MSICPPSLEDEPLGRADCTLKDPAILEVEDGSRPAPRSGQRRRAARTGGGHLQGILPQAESSLQLRNVRDRPTIGGRAAGTNDGEEVAQRR